MSEDRVDALFARYVEQLVVRGVRLAVTDLAGGVPSLAAALAQRIEAFRTIEEVLSRPREPLTGRTLGRYRVHESLGAGGMGEVYRAEDRALHREVAIKVLPPLFALDPQRRARFKREARLLAALRHPSIAAIYGSEHVEDVSFLVMELVPGETLAERISRGRLGVEEALSLFRGIAEGLQSAHALGIIHRDLKPLNVKITPEGRPKVLDFSLGKAIGRGDAAVLARSSASRLSRTMSGMILGTPSYMSPEQARGRQVDERTDVWSFACVLYETLTGRRAFEGETYSDIVASVVAAEPQWSALPAEVPPSLRRLLRRCLEKDPDARPPDFGKVRRALDRPVATGAIGSLPLAAVVLVAVAAMMPAAAPPLVAGRPLAAASPISTARPEPPVDPQSHRRYLQRAFTEWQARLGPERYRALEEASSTAYVTTRDPYTVTLIDVRGGRLRTALPLSVMPAGGWVTAAPISPDGGRLFVVHSGTADVSVLDTATVSLRMLPKRRPFPAEPRASRAAVTPDGRRMYITDPLRGVPVLDVDPGSATFGAWLSVPDGAAIRVGRRVHGIAITRDGKRAYVTNIASHTVSVLDTDLASPQLNTVLSVPDGHAIRVGLAPGGLEFSLDGRRLYVANGASEDVTVIDTDSRSRSYHTELTRIPLAPERNGPSYPEALSLAPDGTRLYVTLRDSSQVAVIDTSSNAVVLPHIGLEAASPTDIVLTADGRRALVQAVHRVLVIDTDPTSATFHHVVATVAIEAEPNSVVVAPPRWLADRPRADDR